jgi:hypothetical protein
MVKNTQSIIQNLFMHIGDTLYYANKTLIDTAQNLDQFRDANIIKLMLRLQNVYVVYVIGVVVLQFLTEVFHQVLYILIKLLS